MSAKKAWRLCTVVAWRALRKETILERTMNRFLVGGCLTVLLGCGARTESFTDLDGAGGQLQGAGGAGITAGAPQVAGAPNIAGAPHVAGAPGFGGTPNLSAGAPGVGGAPNASGGAPGVGGRANVTAGAPGHGGTPNLAAGAPGIAGAPNAKGGSPGSGATSGIIEACQVIAGNSCQQCLCKTCSSPIVDCFSNFGCALILACAQQSGCQGLACYSAQSCRPVIDRFGGLTGAAMNDVLSLLTCSNASQDTCSCN